MFRMFGPDCFHITPYEAHCIPTNALEHIDSNVSTEQCFAAQVLQQQGSNRTIWR